MRKASKNYNRRSIDFPAAMIISTPDQKINFYYGEEKMGQMAQKISKVDHDELLKALNEALSEEWLAYYQYWVGALVAKGPMRTSIVAEFMEHANEEYDHANKLGKRIIELGGTPVLDPKQWENLARCKYDAPSNDWVMELVKQNLVAERCAIARYQQICEMTFGKDYETFKVSAKILKEEIEHEQEMEDFLADYNAAVEHIGEKIEDPAGGK